MKPCRSRVHPLLWGALIALGAGAVYAAGVLGRAAAYLADPQNRLLPLWHGMVWYSGIGLIGGLILMAADLILFLPGKRRTGEASWDPPARPGVTVTLTACNDEEAIGPAVRDFLSQPTVRRVVVVDNNSKDRTAEEAAAAGARVVIEKRPGYGRCVYRCLEEGISYEDTDLTVLCEGDRTFRGYDLAKLLAYAPHAEIVNGTRIVEQLRAYHTQLTTFMYFGNFVGGKLLEAKHIGRGTFTDLGTTYKLCRNSALQRLLPLVNPAINLEFNAHFLDTALAAGVSVVECPVTFHARVGRSKGGNVSNLRAIKVGIRMLWGMLAGWTPRHTLKR
jgi:hypothetical protein